MDMLYSSSHCFPFLPFPNYSLRSRHFTLSNQLSIINMAMENQTLQKSFNLKNSDAVVIFNDEEKQRFQKAFRFALYVTVIVRYYELTNLPLPTPDSRYFYDGFGLSFQQLKDLAEVVLCHVEGPSRPVTPKPSLIALSRNDLLFPPFIPTVEDAFKYLLRRNKLEFARDIAVGSISCFAIIWAAFVLLYSLFKVKIGATFGALVFFWLCERIKPKNMELVNLVSVLITIGLSYCLAILYKYYF